jgi:hypothetical protein
MDGWGVNDGEENTDHFDLMSDFGEWVEDRRMDQ